MLREQAAKIAKQESDSTHQQNQLAQLEARIISLIDNAGTGIPLTPLKTTYTAPRTKGPTVEKYGGEKELARSFLTNIELYFLYY